MLTIPARDVPRPAALAAQCPFRPVLVGHAGIDKPVPLALHTGKTPSCLATWRPVRAVRHCGRVALVPSRDGEILEGVSPNPYSFLTASSSDLLNLRTGGWSRQSSASNRRRERAARKEVSMGRTRILTTGAALGLAFHLGTASASPVRSPEPAVYSKGLRARIEGTRLRPGKARVHGHARDRRIARKRFGDVWLRGDPTPAESRASTLVATRQAVLACDAPGTAALLSPWPLFPGGLSWRHTCGGAVTLARESWQPASTGLHSGDPHRCAELALPRDSKLRRAILDEFARRFAKNFGVRQPGSLSLRKRGPHLARGSRVPDFVLASLEGEPWSLSKLRGNVVLLNFWASWCEPCRQEMPQLQQLHERHSDDGLVVLGVSDEDPDTARRYLKEHGIDYPSVHDGNGSAMQSYQINAIPTSLIIGRDGELLERVEGYTPASTFSKALKPLLSRTSGSLGSGWPAEPDDTGSRTPGAGRR